MGILVILYVEIFARPAKNSQIIKITVYPVKINSLSIIIIALKCVLLDYMASQIKMVLMYVVLNVLLDSI